MIDKPVKKHVSEKVYNWNACRDYIEKKYSISLRDYYGQFKEGKFNDLVPYYDFWHVIIKYNNIDNGSFMWFDELYVNSSDEYSELDRFLYNLFFDEFGDGDVGERICSFWVDW